MTNKFGMTPLHHAAVHGAGDVLQALLEAGADPNKPDAQGRLPLHWTAAKGHVTGSQVLIEGGARALGPDHEVSQDPASSKVSLCPPGLHSSPPMRTGGPHGQARP